LALSRRYHSGVETEEIFAVILVVVENSNRDKAAIDPSIVSPIVEMEKSYKLTLPSFNCSVDTVDNSQTTMLNENSCDKLTTSITGIAPQEIDIHTPFTAPMNKSYTHPIPGELQPYSTSQNLYSYLLLYSPLLHKFKYRRELQYFVK
jgi:hypothetical protein